MLDRATLLNLWRLRCIRATIQHYKATYLFRIFDSMLTTINVVASISILYISAIEPAKFHEHGAIEIAALITVVTTVLQYILDYRTRWKTHERAGKGYAILNREIEQLNINQPIDDQDLSRIRQQFAHLTDMSPVIPAVIWNRPKPITRAIARLEKREPLEPPPPN